MPGQCSPSLIFSSHPWNDDKEKILKVLERINSVLGVMDFAAPVVGQEVEAPRDQEKYLSLYVHWHLPPALLVALYGFFGRSEQLGHLPLRLSESITQI